MSRAIPIDEMADAIMDELNKYAEVAADDFLLPGVGHHGEDTLAEIVDGIIEGLALAGARGEHHTGGSFEVFLVDDVVHIALGAVGGMGQVRIVHTIRITCSTVRFVHPVRLVHRDTACRAAAQISVRWIRFFIRVARWQHLQSGHLSASGVPWREWFRAWSGRIGQVCLTRGRRAG